MNYQEMLAALERYWAERSCVIMQPYHTELGAGTANPATFLRSLGPRPWRVAYVEPSIRPTDGRYGENPFRFQQFYQYQVILKPAPEDVLDQYFGSLEAVGIDLRRHDVRLVEDDWEQPSIGAWGLGWEVWCDGMEITQWTYFQQLGGLELDLVPAEITYGTERLAMFLQGKRTAFELEWAPGVTWGDVYRESERQWSAYNFEEAPVDVLVRRFDEHEAEARHLVERRLPLPAYDQALKCSHVLNLLDARGAVSASERAAYILRARSLAGRIARLHVALEGEREAEPPEQAASADAPRPAAQGLPDGGPAGRRLLVEIGVEELPASACYEAERQLPGLVREHLDADPSRVFVGPRRIAFLVDELPERTGAELVKGPPVALRERAAAGFAGRHGLDPDALEERDGFLWAPLRGDELRGETLRRRLDAIVRGFQFRKSMRWDDSGRRFARPVRWVLAKLDGETVWGSGVSSGHRFTHGSAEVPSADAYVEVLREARVEPDAAERRRRIVEALDALGEWRDPLGKLDEVVHMAEWPEVHGSSFGEGYLRLPERLIVAAMQSHQRYFPLGGNRFALVANGGDPAVTVPGYTRVLEARLDDAAFTFDRDLAVGIEGLAGRLGSITFFEGAGSFADKRDRMVELVRRLGGREDALEAARLAKADQAAELVREFPDLEGYIGAEYARQAGVPEAVALAIEEHHLPDAAGGPLPAGRDGMLVAAADKLDTLAVSFSLGHRPSGSRDPYGLRRAAIGLCRLAAEGGLSIQRELMPEEVREFVEERFEGLLEVPVEFVRAARRAPVADLGAVARLAVDLAAEADSEAFAAAYTVYDRANRIAGRAAAEAAPSLDRGILEEEAERELADRVAELGLEEADGNVRAMVAEAAALAPLVERFFDEVLVMTDDERLRANRLRLLLDLRDRVGRLGDLSEIPR